MANPGGALLGGERPPLFRSTFSDTEGWSWVDPAGPLRFPLGELPDGAPELRVTVEPEHEIGLVETALGANDARQVATLLPAPTPDHGEQADQGSPSIPGDTLAPGELPERALAEKRGGFLGAGADRPLPVGPEAARDVVGDAETDRPEIDPSHCRLASPGAIEEHVLRRQLLEG